MTMISIQIWQERKPGGRGYGDPFDPLPYTPPEGTTTEPGTPIGPEIPVPGVGDGLRWAQAAVIWDQAGLRWIR